MKTSTKTMLATGLLAAAAGIAIRRGMTKTPIDPVDELDAKVDAFLRRHLPRALSRMSLSDDVSDFTATLETERAMFGHGYLLRSARGHEFRLWCGLNVDRIIVAYYVRHLDPTHAAPAEHLREIFAYTFDGASRLGYKTAYEAVRGGEEGLHSVWSTVVADAGLLSDPARTLFWAQDVAMMTQCLIRTALRHSDEVSLDTITPPRPL